MSGVTAIESSSLLETRLTVEATIEGEVGIRKNPYDVGYTPRKTEDLFGRCSCCGVHVVDRGVPGYDPIPDCCEDCADHYQIEDEPVERELSRLRAHDEYQREYVRKVRQHANEVEAKAGRQQAAVRSALEQRAKYREALVAVWRLHRERPDGTCECGARAPCPTTSAINAERDVVRWVSSEATNRDLHED